MRSIRGIIGKGKPGQYPSLNVKPHQYAPTGLPQNLRDRALLVTPPDPSPPGGEGEISADQVPSPRVERGFRDPLKSLRRTLKRSGYDQKSPLKGLLTSPFSGLTGFFHSCPVSTGSDKTGTPLLKRFLRGEVNPTDSYDFCCFSLCSLCPLWWNIFCSGEGIAISAPCPTAPNTT